MQLTMALLFALSIFALYGVLNYRSHKRFARRMLRDVREYLRS